MIPSKKSTEAARWRERHAAWAAALGDVSAPSVGVFEPLPPWRLQELARLRALNAELQARREDQQTVEVEEEAVGEKKEDEDDEELPTLNSPGAAPGKQITARHVPGKRADADESLFTKYA